MNIYDTICKKQLCFHATMSRKPEFIAHFDSLTQEFHSDINFITILLQKDWKSELQNLLVLNLLGLPQQDEYSAMYGLQDGDSLFLFAGTRSVF